MGKPKTLVSLTGGLGNQLFQLAAGLYVSERSDVALTGRFGRPRSQRKNQADIFEYEQVVDLGLQDLSKNEYSWLSRKASGYLMRTSFAPRAWEDSTFYRLLIKLITSLVASLSLRELRVAYAPSEVGFDKEFHSSAYSRILFGYFQTYHLPANPSVLPFLRELKLKRPSAWVNEMAVLAALEKPTAVHLRLTDYRNEGFGIAPLHYYENALALLRSQGNSGRIWLFSDEPEEARLLLGEDLLIGARIITEPPGSSPAEVLEVLRLAHAYVIANSTFSWWGAFLSRSETSAICYPDPWFISGTQIKDLCPPEWTPISR